MRSNHFYRLNSADDGTKYPNHTQKFSHIVSLDDVLLQFCVDGEQVICRISLFSSFFLAEFVHVRVYITWAMFEIA